MRSCPQLKGSFQSLLPGTQKGCKLSLALRSWAGPAQGAVLPTSPWRKEDGDLMDHDTMVCVEREEQVSMSKPPAPQA